MGEKCCSYHEAFYNRLISTVAIEIIIVVINAGIAAVKRCFK